MEKFSAVIGTLIAFILVFLSMGNFSQFFDPASIMIVLGGTIGTTLVVSGVSGMKLAMQTTKVAMTKTNIDKVNELVRVQKLAIKARKKNILALEYY